MSIAISPSEQTRVRFAPVRAQGRIRLVFDRRDDRTVIRDVGEGGGFRARFPDVEGMLETVLINTGGGMTGGDHATFDITTGDGAATLVTTQSAEKVYRSNGPETEIDVALTLGPDSMLHWLPQETILFSGARLRRRLNVSMDENARLLMGESVVYGRFASGEDLGEGLFTDRWQIRRAGALVFAEALRLDGHLSTLMKRPAVANGARSSATLIYIAKDAESRLEQARQLLSDAPCDAGASAWNGMLVVRLLSGDPSHLRQVKIGFLARFRGEEVSRLW